MRGRRDATARGRSGRRGRINEDDDSCALNARPCVVRRGKSRVQPRDLARVAARDATSRAPANARSRKMRAMRTDSVELRDRDAKGARADAPVRPPGRSTSLSLYSG
jgi:hypothetical protein|eukprot:31235-Pelagococcus_subviridis.AAC.2